MNVPTLEEEYLAGEISTNDFLYLLLARTEMEIIQTDLSQTESDRDLVECCIPTLRNSSQTQINKTGEYNFIQRDRKYVDYESIYNRLSKCEGYRKQNWPKNKQSSRSLNVFRQSLNWQDKNRSDAHANTNF